LVRIPSAYARIGGNRIKTSELERLRQLGELREKGLLTDAEFEQEKNALVGGGQRSSRGGRSRNPAARWAGRVAVLVALVVAGAALYLALDARSQARTNSRETAALREKIAAFKPVLVLQRAIGRTQRVPDDGYRHNVTVDCPTGSTAIGGGWATTGGSIPDMIASFSEQTQWIVGASGSGGTARMSADAVCLRGSGGLTVLSRF
jgi:hypothetical protein